MATRKSSVRRTETVRYLVLSIAWDRRWCMYEVVGAQADTANLATNAGVCATFNLTEDEVKQMLAHFELKRAPQLRGAPFLAQVSYRTANALEEAKFIGPVH